MGDLSRYWDLVTILLHKLHEYKEGRKRIPHDGGRRTILWASYVADTLRVLKKIWLRILPNWLHKVNRPLPSERKHTYNSDLHTKPQTPFRNTDTANNGTFTAPSTPKIHAMPRDITWVLCEVVNGSSATESLVEEASEMLGKKWSVILQNPRQSSVLPSPGLPPPNIWCQGTRAGLGCEEYRWTPGQGFNSEKNSYLK